MKKTHKCRFSKIRTTTAIVEQPSKSNTSHIMLTLNEAASYLNLSPILLGWFTVKGKFRFVKKKGLIYFKLSDLDNWLDPVGK